MTENKNYYKKKLILFLFIITTIFGLLSLFGYYSAKIQDPLQLLSAVLYGTIKLFLFVSPISPEEKTPFIYEFAKWAAPILTSAFIFTQISNVLLHVKNVFVNRLSAKHVLFFGNSEMGELLIGNLQKEKNYKISLVTKDFLDERVKNKYEKKGIACYQLDFEKSDKNEIKELFSTLNISGAKYIFFCGESDLENFSLYANVIQRIKPKKSISTYVHCESGTVAGYMEELLKEERKKEESLKKLDSLHFNQKDLTVRLIMEDELVRKSLFRSLTGLSDIGSDTSPAISSYKESDTSPATSPDMSSATCLATSSTIPSSMPSVTSGAKDLSVENMDEAIRPPHILLFGINDLSLPLIKQLANDATLSLRKNTRLTLIDDAASRNPDIQNINQKVDIQKLDIQKMDMQNMDMQNMDMQNMAPVTGLKRALEIDCFDLGSSTEEWKQQENLRQYLKSIREESAPLLIFLMHQDVIRNLKALKLINRYFEKLPKIIRNVSKVDLTKLLPKNEGRIRSFGDLSEIMTGRVIIREELDKRAKAFNKSYNQASSIAGMGEGTSWNELSYVRKTSSRQSASHAAIKEEILKTVFKGKSSQEMRTYLKEKFEEFARLQDLQKESKEVFQKEFRAFLKENPVLDFLSRLEHKRWCNSYYAMGFRYGEKKDESRKTHPCLIEDWEMVIGEKFDICHPEYDLLSVFTLFQEER